MQSCELVTFISTFSCCLAKGKTVEEIAMLSSVLVLIGDNLAAIAAQESLCQSLQGGKSNEVINGIDIRTSSEN